ncbi:MULTISPECIES: alpha/beta hydrolase family protein [Actinomyces]|uniref:Alpha/beta hydrolase fold n=3 Tax=Actinomycetaceae TaxID=2049 RepID=A0A1M4S0N0_9ACTO|nr:MULTISPECIES: hypothetical protein [Actinomyces]CED92363.1 Alpha/beta hydrolase fold-3 [Actinomyces succiniciruminis]SHE25796.1 alpha/beta hydrolase fold [Actinomyces glycerinitolerans]
MMRRQLRRRASLAVVMAVVIGLLLASGARYGPEQSQPAVKETATAVIDSGDVDGPHAPVDRVPAHTTVELSDGAVVRDFDLGDVELGPQSNPGAFRAPVRGVLVTPDTEAQSAPLVIFSHLRTFGCADDTFGYPCARGVEEIRADRGMTYFGKALAAQGYAVLIPDLSPLWSGAELSAPYDQVAGWLATVGRMREEAIAASAGRDSVLGEGLTGAVDASRTALIMHSRSAGIANAAVESWRESASPITSLMSYGGDYGVPDGPEADFAAPAPAYVPLLAVDGDADRDVKQAGPMWLAEHIGQPRSAPAISVRLPGYGHNYINRALSERGFDDRVLDEGMEAPKAADHERMLTDVAVQWLAQTVRGETGAIPTSSMAELPEQLVGIPARWLIAPGVERVSWTASGDAADAPALTALNGGSVTTCRTYADMDPNQYSDRCPYPEVGVLSSRSFTAAVTLTDGGGGHLDTDAHDVQSLAVHLAPTGDRADGLTHTPLRVVVTAADGSRYVLEPSGRLEALRNLARADANGDYTLATIRFVLPEEAASTHVVGVDLTGGPAGGNISVRGVDLVTAGR